MANLSEMLAELRDMVKSTIVPNNAGKQITGQAIYDAFMAQIDAIEEASKMGSSSGGGGVYILPAGMMTASNEKPYEFTPEESAEFFSAMEHYPAVAVGFYDEMEGAGTLIMGSVITTSTNQEFKTYQILSALPITSSSILVYQFTVGVELASNAVMGAVQIGL